MDFYFIVVAEVKMSTVIAETGFATISIPAPSPATEFDDSKRISVGVGLGRVVCPEVRKKNNTHELKKTTFFE